MWVVALVVLGMPHGAADWAVHQAAAKRDHRRGGLIGFTPYLLWMAACGALLWLLPVWACVAFFALTALHFGLEDVDSTKPKRESSEERRGPRGLLAVLRGGPVLLIPFAVAPAAAWQPFALVTGEPITASLAVIVAAVALTLWIASAICLGGMLLINPLRWDAPERTRFAMETLVAWVMLALLPPLLAVGIYFLAVHAWKHTQRLGQSPAIVGIRHDAAWWRRVIAVHRVSLGLLLLSWLFVLPWAWWLGGLTPIHIAAASIGFYIVSTLPHHLLGERWFA